MTRFWKQPLLCVTALFAAQPLQPQTPMGEKDIEALLQEVMSNHRKQAMQLTEYTADRTEICRDLNWRGAVVEETTVSDHFQSWNRNLDVILSVNGKARSEKRIQEEREEAVRFMEIDMNEKPTSPNAEGPEYGSRRGHFSMSIFQIYRNAVFTNFRTELLNERPVIVLDFSPRPDLNRKPLPVGHLCGTVWIDAADRVTAKLTARATPLEGESAEKSEPVFVQTYSRTAEGIWVGSYTRLNPSVKPAFFNDETFDWVIYSLNYRRFSVGVVILRQENPKGPRK